MNRETMTAALYTRGVPEHLHYGLIEWVMKGTPPGSFLTAVLKNDLMGAFGQADDVSAAGLPALVMWLYNDVPSPCWGGGGEFPEWEEAGGLSGIRGS